MQTAKLTRIPMTQSREIRLKARPNGLPTADNFELASVDLAAPGAGEVQVRNHWMTVDPYMRGRMNDVKSYTPPFQLGQTMEGGAVGQVTASNDPSLKVGDMVQSNFGWREAFNAPAAAVQKLPSQNLPPQTYLGAAGMPGLTAYAGLLRVAALKEGDVVFVSGAAGAVGSMVAQIAKAKGNTVIGSAGGPEKVAFLKSLGVDHVIDYKAQKDLNAALGLNMDGFLHAIGQPASRDGDVYVYCVGAKSTVPGAPGVPVEVRFDQSGKAVSVRANNQLAPVALPG